MDARSARHTTCSSRKRNYSNNKHFNKHHAFSLVRISFRTGNNKQTSKHQAAARGVNIQAAAIVYIQAAAIGVNIQAAAIGVKIEAAAKQSSVVIFLSFQLLQEFDPATTESTFQVKGSFYPFPAPSRSRVGDTLQELGHLLPPTSYFILL